MEKIKKTFKKQMSKIVAGGMFLAMVFLAVGVGVVEKTSATDTDTSAKPDFVISDLKIENGSLDYREYIRVTIENKGGEISPFNKIINIEIKDIDTEDIYTSSIIYTPYIHEYVSGYTKEISSSPALKSKTSNVYRLEAIIDTTNAYEESNENNNTYTETIAIFPISLKKGYNLISMPVEPNSPNIMDVIKSIDGVYSSVSYLDKNRNRETFGAEGSPHPETMNVKAGECLEIYMKADMVFKIYGNSVNSNTFDFKEGWNSFGIKSLSNQLVTDVVPAKNIVSLFRFKDGVERVGDESNYKEFYPTDFVSLESGRGYWVDYTEVVDSESISRKCPDINNDEIVNYLDLGIMSDSLNACAGDNNYNLAADLNYDNCVNNEDVAYLQNENNWLKNSNSIDSCEKVNSATPSISVISPNGGEKWGKGKTYTATWQSSGYDKVNVSLNCENYGYGPYYNILSSPNGGSYSFYISTNSPAQNRCKVVVDDSTITNIISRVEGVNSDSSDNYFSIGDTGTATSSITVTSPNGGEELKIGETHQVKWSTTGDINQVTVALNKNGVYIKNLIWNINNNGSISWTPDLSLVLGDDYKIRITNPDDSSIYDESDNYFSISKPAGLGCLPDNTLIKVPNDPRIYIIKNCQRQWIRTAEKFKQGGYRWEDVQESTSNVVNSLPEVSEPSQEIKEGAIVRAIGDVDIYIVKYVGNKRFKRLILNPSVFNSYGHLKWEDVIEVEKETVNSFTTSNLVRNAETGNIYDLTANGDSGMKRHFKSISAMQRLGYDLDAVYEINKPDENSYKQGKDLG